LAVTKTQFLLQLAIEVQAAIMDQNHDGDLPVYRIFFVLLLLPTWVYAAFYPAPPPGSDIIGEPKIISIPADKTLIEIAREQEVGLYEILEANPTLDPEHLVAGDSLTIPSQYILPSVRDNLVVNLSELRAYFFPASGDFVFTTPVGVGRRGWETPTGDATITDKREHPEWTAPLSVRRDMAKQGVYVPPVMPPGPKNPLGDHAMRISIPGYAIHGTNRPYGVGRRVSAGCIRFSPEGIKELFDLVDIGTPIHLIDEPFKAGWKNGQLYFEAHRPLYEQRQQYGANLTSFVKQAFSLLEQKESVAPYLQAAQKIAHAHTGIPEKIG
jgi:L,D-transpeptidase ErfK/SrfK